MLFFVEVKRADESRPSGGLELGRAHFVRAKVCLHAYSEGRLAILHGPRCLMAFDPGDEAVETFDAAA